MTIEQIVIVMLAVVLVVAVVGLIVLLVRYQSLKKKVSSGDRLAPEVIVKDGVRYSKDPAIEKDGVGTVSHAEGDFVLAAGKTYRAKRTASFFRAPIRCLRQMMRRIRSNCASEVLYATSSTGTRLSSMRTRKCVPSPFPSFCAEAHVRIGSARENFLCPACVSASAQFFIQLTKRTGRQSIVRKAWRTVLQKFVRDLRKAA